MYINGWSHYLIFLIVPMLLGLWAQWRVKSTYRKYSQVRTTDGKTGAEVAQEILDAAQIHDVQIMRIGGTLSDHYDPTTKRLCLSGDIYDQPSVAAAGIAAHETGHAIQHAKAYAPLKWRMMVIPATNFASRSLNVLMTLCFVLFFVKPLLSIVVIKLIVICLFVLAIFQLLTLPVEFDASRRAKLILTNMGLVSGEESAGVNRVLNAAAWTYVAALVAILGQLLYYLTALNRRN